MPKVRLLYGVIATSLLLAGVALLSVGFFYRTSSGHPSIYTDKQAEVLAKGLSRLYAVADGLEQVQAFVTHQAVPPLFSNETVLQSVGIDIQGLTMLDAYVGNCIDFATYDLSKSYLLIVGSNYCGDINGVTIKKK